jgi:multicomponent Na+:H+ antiporter subunit E
MKTKIILFIAAFFTWLLLSCSLEPGNLVIAAVTATIVFLVTGDIFPEGIKLLKGPARYLRFIFQYLPLFVWECLKANLDGAWRVVRPGLPMRPGIVKVKTVLKSDAALTFLANSLTLKPGTLTVDIDKEAGYLYVHCVDVKSVDIPQATEEVVLKFERVLQRIFE